MARAFDAVSLDVGGVLVVPDHGTLAGALTRAGVPYDRSRFGIGHYLAMAAMDDAASGPEVFTDYLRGFLAGGGRAGGRPGDRPRRPRSRSCSPRCGASRCRDHAPACGRWPTPACAWRSRRTATAPWPTTSRRHEWLQVGDGPGVPVEVITDSGVVGVGKPDPRVFQATIDALALPPERILHIGDASHYDVDGARGGRAARPCTWTRSTCARPPTTPTSAPSPRCSTCLTLDGGGRRYGRPMST